MGRPIFPRRLVAANINLEQFRSELSDEMELEAGLPDEVARKRAKELTHDDAAENGRELAGAEDEVDTDQGREPF